MMNFIHTFNEICWFIVFLIYIPFMIYWGISWFTTWRESYKEFKKYKFDKDLKEWCEKAEKPKE